MRCIIFIDLVTAKVSASIKKQKLISTLDLSSPSYWELQSYRYEADLVIIGGGITGLSTAIEVAQVNPSLDIVVLEALALGNLASTRNAGFACFGSVGELIDDLKVLDRDQVAGLVAMRYEGLQRLDERLGEGHIQWSGGMEVYRSDGLEGGKCLGAIPDINDLVRHATGLEDTFSAAEHQLDTAWINPLSCLNRYEGKLNPVQMMQRLKDVAKELGVRVFTGQTVSSIDVARHAVIANGQPWSYGQLAICNNALAADFVDLDVKPVPNVVGYMYKPPIRPLRAAYHLDRGYFYLRTTDEGALLVGGGRHQVDQTAPLQEQIVAMQGVLADVLRLVTEDDSAVYDGYWHGYLGVGQERLPLIGSLHTDVYYGVRLGGMGVAIGSYLGHKLAIKMTS
jgi:glycine/D-amino acid oxidase-like deaminating enzyme